MKNVKEMQKFNQNMSRRKYSKGGYIRKIGGRHYFAPGGAINPNTLQPGNGINVQNAVNPNTGIAGTIGNALGLNNNFQAGAANIQAGTNADQLQTSYNNAQQPVFNQNQIAMQTLPGVQQGVNNEAIIANQLAGVAAGTGPNPAQAALNQNTGQNIAQQAALAAGVRGGGTNAGLIAQQNAQTGAGIQQNDIGQAATQQAAQQLAAQQAGANLAATQVTQGQGATTAANTAAQGEQGILQNANTAYNNAGVNMQSNINNVNSATAAANQQENNGIFGGIASMASSLPVVGSLFKGLAKGGNVCAGPHQSHVANFMSEGGETGSVPAMVSPGERYLNKEEVRQVVEDGANPRSLGKVFKGKAKVKGDSLKNDILPETLEEGGVVIPRHVETKKDRHRSELFVRRATHMKRPAA